MIAMHSTVEIDVNQLLWNHHKFGLYFFFRIPDQKKIMVEEDITTANHSKEKTGPLEDHHLAAYHAAGEYN